MLLHFNKKFILFYKKSLQKKKYNWTSFFNKPNLTSKNNKDYEVLKRRARYIHWRLNIRIFFSKRNKFFRNLTFVLGFSRLNEKKKRLKRQRMFFVFLCFLYGLKRVKQMKTKIQQAKKAFLKKQNLQLLISTLESQLVIVLIRMLFVLNNAWAKYILFKKLIYVNGLLAVQLSYPVIKGDLITINLLEYLNIRDFIGSKANKQVNLNVQQKKQKRFNFYFYCKWLFQRTGAMFKLFYKPIKSIFFNYYRRGFLKHQLSQIVLLNFFVKKNTKLIFNDSTLF